ncbi:MAG TPA: hypothetical protein VHZ27_13840 [Solirubrobacteraceae bacterium]|nr:hypothetical protein [Solirubrobacteraceae bacterium]
MDPFELVVLGVFASMSVWVLALGLWWTLTQGRVWSGVDGVYVQDVTQYLAWIRDASRHVLVSDLFVLRETPHDYLQPAIVVSGGLVAIGVSPWVALMLWQPIAVGGVFLGVRVLVHHQLRARLARRSALVLALFGSAIGTFQDLWLPWWTWGYVFGALSLAAMVASLLSYEHAASGSASVWPAATLAGLSSWLHPWQGAVLVLTIVGAEITVRPQARPTGRSRGWHASPRPTPVLVAIALPLAYYALLDHTDPTWRLAEQSLRSGLPVWRVTAMLAPLLGPALLAYRIRPRSFVAAALRTWPPASLAVFLAAEHGLGNEPTHALLGISIPLAILATEGLGTVRRPAITPRRTLATVAVLALTAPQAVSEFASKWRYVRPSASPITPSDWEAIGYLARDPQPGGVLAGFPAGRYIPAETGRRTYIGDVFWSEPHPERRQLDVAHLLAGRMLPYQALAFVAGTGARFLLADCTTRANLQRELAPVISSTHHFGCATVYQLDPKSTRQPYRPSTLAATPARRHRARR